MPPLLRGALGAAVLLVAAPALAHVTLERREAKPGASYRGVLQVNHGCGGAPTLSLTVTMPEGLASVRPMPKPGWQLSLDKAGEATGHDPAPVRAITWSGASLPDDEYDEFVFVARIAAGAKAGETLYFPVEQDCGTRVSHWVQRPTASGETPKEPAPSVRLVAADTAALGGETVKAGDLTLTTPWLRATPGGAKVAGGYVRIVNTGSIADTLVGASLPLADHGEVHEMSMDGGVMKMRPVDGGLAIPPGGSIELKPGGYHLMFMGMNGALKQGDTVKGTLTFARAGTVTVTFRVGGFGAQQAPEAEHQH